MVTLRRTAQCGENNTIGKRRKERRCKHGSLKWTTSWFALRGAHTSVEKKKQEKKRNAPRPTCWALWPVIRNAQFIRPCFLTPRISDSRTTGIPCLEMFHPGSCTAMGQERVLEAKLSASRKTMAEKSPGTRSREEITGEVENIEQYRS